MGFSAGRLPLSTPFDLPGLALILRADMGVKLVGGAASSWSDPRPTGLSFTQPTPSKQPTLNANDPAYNYQPTFSFASGSSQELVGSLLGIAQPLTIYVVGESTSGSGLQMFCGSNSYNSPTVYWNNSIWAFFSGGGGNNSANATRSKQCFAAVFNGASSSLYINSSTAPVAGSSLISTAIQAPSFAIGSWLGTDFLNGKMAEIEVCYGAHTPQIVSGKLQYDSARYGLVAA